MLRTRLCHVVLLSLLAPITVRLAHAGPLATAYADVNITNFSLETATPGNFTLIPPPVTSTSTFADLDSVMDTSTDTQALDAMRASQGPGSAGLLENDFALHPGHLAHGDVVIAQNLLSVRTDGLVNLLTPDRGRAFGTASLQADFRLANADTLTISFTADMLMKVLLQQDVLANSLALARIVVDITIDELFGNMDRVFLWRPNGVAGGITGGAENADPFSLDDEIVQSLPGMKTVDPAAAMFSATTNQLFAGDYRIDILVSADALAEVTGVPEPSTFFLLGAGIVGLAIVRRSKSSSKPIIGAGCDSRS